MITVSAIIPAYNAEATLARAIDSCFAQTHPLLEIIVVDDGSTDKTADIARSYPSPLRLESQTNAGPSAARNAGARVATGEWLAFLDADDRWRPTKTERQLALVNSTDVAIVHTHINEPQHHLPLEVTFSHLWEANRIGTSAVLMRRSVFERLGGFNEIMRTVEDYNLWLRVAASGATILTCPEVLTEYSRGNGLSSDLKNMLDGQLYNIDSIGREFSIARTLLHSKKLQVFDDIGRAALYRRTMRLARSVLTKAFIMRPTLDRAFLLGASFAPRYLLDRRRRFVRDAVR